MSNIERHVDDLVKTIVLNAEKEAYLEQQQTDPFIRGAISDCSDCISNAETELEKVPANQKENLLKTYVVRFVRTPDEKGVQAKCMNTLLNQMDTASILGVLEKACTANGVVNALLLKACSYGDLGTLLNKGKKSDTELLNRASRQDLIRDFPHIIKDFSEGKYSQTLRNRLSAPLYRECLNQRWTMVKESLKNALPLDKFCKTGDFLKMKNSDGLPLYAELGVKEILPLMEELFLGQNKQKKSTVQYRKHLFLGLRCDNDLSNKKSAAYERPLSAQQALSLRKAFNTKE